MSPDSSPGEFAAQVQGGREGGRNERRRRWGREEVHVGKQDL